jgi:hypothetical protein
MGPGLRRGPDPLWPLADALRWLSLARRRTPRRRYARHERPPGRASPVQQVDVEGRRRTRPCSEEEAAPTGDRGRHLPRPIHRGANITELTCRPLKEDEAEISSMLAEVAVPTGHQANPSSGSLQARSYPCSSDAAWSPWTSIAFGGVSWALNRTWIRRGLAVSATGMARVRTPSSKLAPILSTSRCWPRNI